MQWKVFPIVILIIAGLNGCASIRPATVAPDRFDYTTAISDSWKAQVRISRVSTFRVSPIATHVASGYHELESEFELTSRSRYPTLIGPRSNIPA
jgi:hypothetical protein